MESQVRKRGKADARSRWPLRRRIAAASTCLGAVLGIVYALLPPREVFRAPLSYVIEARDGTLLSARIAADGQWRFPPGRQVPQ